MEKKEQMVACIDEEDEDVRAERFLKALDATTRAVAQARERRLHEETLAPKPHEFDFFACSSEKVVSNLVAVNNTFLFGESKGKIMQWDPHNAGGGELASVATGANTMKLGAQSLADEGGGDVERLIAVGDRKVFVLPLDPSDSLIHKYQRINHGLSIDCNVFCPIGKHSCVVYGIQNDGRWVDLQAEIVDLETGESRSQHKLSSRARDAGPDIPVACCAASSGGGSSGGGAAGRGGNTIITSLSDGRLCGVDPRVKDSVYSLSGASDMMTDITANGMWVFGGCRNGSIYIWDVRNPRDAVRAITWRNGGHSFPVTCLAVNESGVLAAGCAETGNPNMLRPTTVSVRLFDTPTVDADPYRRLEPTLITQVLAPGADAKVGSAVSVAIDMDHFYVSFQKMPLAYGHAIDVLRGAGILVKSAFKI